MGDAVQVFSRAAGAWVEAEVADVAEDGVYVHVQYEVGSAWRGKNLHMHSDDLRVASTASSEGECDPGWSRSRSRRGSQAALPIGAMVEAYSLAASARTALLGASGGGKANAFASTLVTLRRR